MSLDADRLVDRRRLTRKVSLWRAAAFLLALAAVVLVAVVLGGEDGGFGRGPHVARIEISGLITDDRKQQALVKRAAKDGQVKAILLAINSPGGTTTGSEALFLTLREAAEKKPVVAVMGTIATSGGYIAAIGADRIFARGNSITGSIGVIFQWAQVREALEKLGVRMETVKSSPLKAEPSPFSDTSPEAREVMREMVADSYAWFLDLVADRRGLGPAEVRQLGDGRVYTGRQALSAKLIDEIGGEQEAVAWLAREHGLDRDIGIRDWKKSRDLQELGLLEGLARSVLKALTGGAGTLGFPGNFDAMERLRLDGLISVWQAPGEKAE